MLVGVPKEVKTHEYRVGLVPASVRELVHHGHQVLIETQAGVGSGLTDENYVEHGARIVTTADEVFTQADLIVTATGLHQPLPGAEPAAPQRRERPVCGQDRHASAEHPRRHLERGAGRRGR